MEIANLGVNALYIALFWGPFIVGIYAHARRRGIARPFLRAILFGAFGPGGAVVYWIRHGQNDPVSDKSSEASQ
ncbi:hypothetical protein SAMN04489842_2599 [Natronobacterium texcoconense]|uniref:Phospholipase_D-nuclease N-terminal n=1 Tax=Natronobacterium texcoconense TaxID=1095778 RepID=A0A1H1GU63_NATTX|nr:hypothetical protein SAMN04489842_2599 [Natronobacterium texcoconense]